MHIAVFDANSDTSDLVRHHPGETAKFQSLLTSVVPDWTFAPFRVHRDQFPEGLTGLDGIIISGSPASANDPDAWVSRLMDTIRAAVNADIPVFGACFGHQAVARALGGKVARNDHGWSLGRIETDNHSPASWMPLAPPRIALHGAHKEQVVVVPKGARILAGIAGVPVGHLALGSRVFTTQYHPEFTRDFMAALLEELALELDAPLIDQARASLTRDADGPLMARWMVNFFAQTLR